MKTIFITYCSKEKDESSELLEAIKRYKSNRIQKVYKTSQLVTVDFMILSGEFGLLKSTDKIPYYDHLLLMEEVNKYTKKLIKQLVEINNTRPRLREPQASEKNKEKIRIVFFTEYLKNDVNLKPYQISIKTACDKLNIKFIMIEMEKEVNF